MAFEAVLFDLDGTLLDSLQDIAAAANRALMNEGLPTHSLAAYRYLVGEGVQVLMQRAIPESVRTDELVERCTELFRSYYRDAWNVHTQPYPGIVELLNNLKVRRIASAVLSNKPHDFTQRCIAYYFPDHAFGAVLGCRDNVPRKPHPAGALEISRQLGIVPEKIVFLGDTRIDVQTALAAGMTPVGALWGFRDEKELRQAGAKAVIRTPMELLTLLNDAAHANERPQA